MNQAKVSVIVPFYNSKKYLHETIEALINQSFVDMEIILVDDGSTDGGLDIAEYYNRLNQGIKIIHNITNSGLYNARLIGIEQATGEYIAFCDSDDIPYRDMISKMYTCAQITDSDMVVCGYVREEMDTGKILSEEMVSLGEKTYYLPDDSYILQAINPANWNKLIKHEILSNIIHFDQPPKKLEDVIFIGSLYPFIKKISFLPEVLYRYRVHPEGLMSYVDDDEIELFREGMKYTRGYIQDNIRDPGMLSEYDSIAFIHLGLSVVLRQVDGGKNPAKAYKGARAFLSCHFPLYKKAGYTLTWNIKHSFILVRILFARWVFSVGWLMIFSLFVYKHLANKQGLFRW